MYDYFMKKKVYQKFILGCENIEEALSKGLGGVIFFSKDINSELQVKKQIAEIKEKALISPFISIDQEGGRVERTENIRSKRLSPRFSFQKGEDFLTRQADEILSEIKDLGFNLNFAPCIDVNTNPQNPIIGERAFSDNSDDVIKGMKIFVEQSRKNSVIPCVKHFPGHGDADKDSHLELPMIDLSMQTMEETHIRPFKEAVKDNIEMVMVAHLYCTCFDKTSIPSSLSSNVVGYLRNTLGYKGVVITDDMIMRGVESYGSLEACIMAIKAGVDMFIFRNSDEKTLKLIEELVLIVEKDKDLRQKVEESFERIIALKSRFNL